MDTRGTPLRVTVDASIFLAVCLSEDDAVSVSLTKLFEDQATYITQPAIWTYEIVNGLRTAERRGRIDSERSRRALVDTAALPIEVESGFPLERSQDLLETARAFSMSAYDAAYVAYCKAQDSALWTLDHNLRTAAQKAGIKTL